MLKLKCSKFCIILHFRYQTVYNIINIFIIIIFMIINSIKKMGNVIEKYCLLILTIVFLFFHMQALLLLLLSRLSLLHCSKWCHKTTGKYNQRLVLPELQPSDFLGEMLVASVGNCFSSLSKPKQK